jgi:hypothetical protein
MRIYILILFLTLLTSCAGESFRQVSPDLDSGDIAVLRNLKRDQPVIWRIGSWRGEPMVTTKYGAEVLTTDQAMTRLEASPGVSLRDAVECGGKAWALEISKQGSRLLKYDDERWQEERSFVTAANPPEDVRLVADVDRPAVMTRTSIWRFQGQRWKQTALPPRMVGSIPLANYYYGNAGLYDLHLVLLRNLLFVGINRGEDGGAVSQLDLDVASPAWTVFGMDPVNGLVVDRNQTLWCGTGSLHLSALRGALYCYVGQSWQTIFDVGGLADPTTESVFGHRSPMSAIALGPDKSRPYLLASDAGIFRRDHARLVPVVHFPEDNDSMEISNGMLVGTDETFYVATYDAGLLIFAKGANRYQVRRVNLAEVTGGPR